MFFQHTSRMLANFGSGGEAERILSSRFQQTIIEYSSQSKLSPLVWLAHISFLAPANRFFLPKVWETAAACDLVRKIRQILRNARGPSIRNHLALNEEVSVRGDDNSVLRLAFVFNLCLTWELFQIYPCARSNEKHTGNI